MSFKFDPKAAEGRKYVSAPGTYDVAVESAKFDYMPPRSDFYAKLTLVTDSGEIVPADLFKKPEKSGEHARLNQFIAATATKAEIDALLKRGEFEVDEDFLKEVVNTSVGRRLKVVVTERKYTRKDGTEGVAHNGSYFRRLPEGPEQPY